MKLIVILVIAFCVGGSIAGWQQIIDGDGATIRQDVTLKSSSANLQEEVNDESRILCPPSIEKNILTETVDKLFVEFSKEPFDQLSLLRLLLASTTLSFDEQLRLLNQLLSSDIKAKVKIAASMIGNLTEQDHKLAHIWFEEQSEKDKKILWLPFIFEKINQNPLEAWDWLQLNMPPNPLATYIDNEVWFGTAISQALKALAKLPGKRWQAYEFAKQQQSSKSGLGISLARAIVKDDIDAAYEHFQNNTDDHTLFSALAREQLKLDHVAAKQFILEYQDEVDTTHVSTLAEELPRYDAIDSLIEFTQQIKGKHAQRSVAESIAERLVTFNLDETIDYIKGFENYELADDVVGSLSFDMARLPYSASDFFRVYEEIFPNENSVISNYSFQRDLARWLKKGDEIAREKMVSIMSNQNIDQEAKRQLYKVLQEEAGFTIREIEESK